MRILDIFKRIKKGDRYMMTLEEFEDRIKRVRILKHKVDNMKIFKDGIRCEKTVRLSYQPYGSSNDRVEYVDGFYIKKVCEEYYKNLVAEYDKHIEELKEHGLFIENELKEDI